MADTSKKVSELETASQVNNTDLMMLSQGSAGSGFASLKTTILALAQKIVTGINFTSALETEDKTIAGAINEVASGGGGSSTFAGLSDVDIDDTTLANGQVPIWDETEEKWKNGNGGGGTTVIANPTGTPTDELETIQIGNDIYEIVGGGGGGTGGLTKTALYENASGTLESVISLSQSIENFDFVEIVTQYPHSDNNDYRQNAIYNSEELIDTIGTTRPINWHIGNDSIYTWIYITDVDEITVHTNTQASLGIRYVYGYKVASGGGGSAIGKKDILWEYSNSYDITLEHPFTDYDFLVFEGDNYTDNNHKGGAIVSSTELESIRGVSGKQYSFAGVTENGFANYLVSSTTSIPYDSGGGARVLRVWGIKLGGAYKEVEGTLTAGATSITLSDSAITTSSTFEPFTSIFGVNPTNMVAVAGSVTLTFEAQSTNMDVKVRVS